MTPDPSRADETPLTTFAIGLVSLVSKLPGLTERALVDGVACFTAGQKVLTTLADAFEDGLLEEFRAVLRTMEPTAHVVGHVAERLEKTLPLLDTTLDTVVPLAQETLTGVNRAVSVIDHLPSALEELRLVRTAAERVAALAAVGLEPLDLIPGAATVRRQIGKVVPRAKTLETSD